MAAGACVNDADVAGVALVAFALGLAASAAVFNFRSSAALAAILAVRSASSFAAWAFSAFLRFSNRSFSARAAILAVRSVCACLAAALSFCCCCFKFNCLTKARTC